MPNERIDPSRPGSTASERIAALAYDPLAQPTERLPGCNLCGEGGRPVEVARHDRYGYPASFVICGRCGLGYLSPRMTAAAYRVFYSGVYRPLVSAFHGRLIDAATVQGEQLGYAAELAGFLGPLLVSSPRTILDVGGSTGVVGGLLAGRLDARATVLDPAPDELAVARSAGLETITGLAEDYEPGGRQWDLVLLCQTMDHLLDVRGTLIALRRMTADGGHAFIDILDVGFMLDRTGSIERAVKIDHPYYLTPATAEAYFGLAGYRVVAERLSDDGHRGFLLAPGGPVEPDWAALGAGAAALLADVWRRRARGPVAPALPTG